MYIRVYVTPSARKERVEQVDEMLHISVKEPAQGNHANTRVRELVALRYSVPLGRVQILTGHHSPGKMLVVTTKRAE
ncbi:MAG: DUF167 family protein [Candidatus Paceibacterota bacterium]